MCLRRPQNQYFPSDPQYQYHPSTAQQFSQYQQPQHQQQQWPQQLQQVQPLQPPSMHSQMRPPSVNAYAPYLTGQATSPLPTDRFPNSMPMQKPYLGTPPQTKGRYPAQPGSTSPFLRNRIRRSDLQYTMVTTRQGNRNTYTIRGTNTVVRAGDSVMLRHTEESKPIIARVEKIEQDNSNSTRVHVRRYYRPEEAIGGRICFHGEKELFLSDHYDDHSADTIEGRCFVHTFKNYMKLEIVGVDDYFCRFRYEVASGAFTPNRVAVFCTCEMPYNPSKLMLWCENCNQRYHPECMGVPFEEAVYLQVFGFVCSECSSDSDV